MGFTTAERQAWLDRYAAGPARLREAWERVPEEARDHRPQEGAWSAREVVLHCADSETYAAIRIRLLLTDPDPLIVGYDENLWAKVFGYPEGDPARALQLIDLVHAQTLDALRHVPEDAWGRVGRHTQSGPYGTDDWLRSYGEHLEIHARQIQRNLEAWQGR